MIFCCSTLKILEALVIGLLEPPTELLKILLSEHVDVFFFVLTYSTSCQKPEKSAPINHIRHQKSAFENNLSNIVWNWAEFWSTIFFRGAPGRFDRQMRAECRSPRHPGHLEWWKVISAGQTWSGEVYTEQKHAKNRFIMENLYMKHSTLPLKIEDRGFFYYTSWFSRSMFVYQRIW